MLHQMRKCLLPLNHSLTSHSAAAPGAHLLPVFPEWQRSVQLFLPAAPSIVPHQTHGSPPAAAACLIKARAGSDSISAYSLRHAAACTKEDRAQAIHSLSCPFRLAMHLKSQCLAWPNPGPHQSKRLQCMLSRICQIQPSPAWPLAQCCAQAHNPPRHRCSSFHSAPPGIPHQSRRSSPSHS